MASRATLRAFDSVEAELDALLKARIAEALADTRPPVSHEDVFASLKARHEARMARDHSPDFDQY